MILYTINLEDNVKVDDDFGLFFSPVHVPGRGYFLSIFGEVSLIFLGL